MFDDVWEGLSGSLCTDIAHTKYSAIAKFSFLQCGIIEERLKKKKEKKNDDDYSEVVHLWEKMDRDRSWLNIYSGSTCFGCLASQMTKKKSSGY